VTLTNGETSGAPIAKITLEGTSQVSGLTIQSNGKGTAGASFGRLTIDNASGASGALGTLLVKGVSLRPGGRIEADGGMKSITLGDIGAGASVDITGALTTFTAGVIDNNFMLDATGNLGTFSASSVGANSTVESLGGITFVKTLKGALGADVTGTSIANVSVATGGMTGNVLATGSGGIGTVKIVGDFTGDVLAPAGAVKSVQVTGGAVHTTVNAAGDVGGVSITGTGGTLDIITPSRVNTINLGAARTGGGSTITGHIDARYLGNLLGATSDLSYFSIYAPDGIGSVKAYSMDHVSMWSGSIGTVSALGNMLSCTVGAGIGLGPDHQWGGGDDVYPFGNGNIKSVTVSGDMVGSTIVAGVKPGPDGKFGGSDKIYGAVPTDDYAVRRLGFIGQLGEVKVGGHILGATDGSPIYSPGSGAIEAASKIGKISDSSFQMLKPLNFVYGGVVIRTFL
jgi:hypothetical protein